MWKILDAVIRVAWRLGTWAFFNPLAGGISGVTAKVIARTIRTRAPYLATVFTDAGTAMIASAVVGSIWAAVWGGGARAARNLAGIRTKPLAKYKWFPGAYTSFSHPASFP